MGGWTGGAVRGRVSGASWRSRALGKGIQPMDRILCGIVLGWAFASIGFAQDPLAPAAALDPPGQAPERSSPATGSVTSTPAQLPSASPGAVSTPPVAVPAKGPVPSRPDSLPAACAPAACPPTVPCGECCPYVNPRCPCGPCGPAGCMWVNVEYLLWWAKGSPLPPLVSTSPAGTPVTSAGVLGTP